MSKKAESSYVKADWKSSKSEYSYGIRLCKK